jgi:uncharacterized protein with beta-barrel porin domain
MSESITIARGDARRTLLASVATRALSAAIAAAAVGVMLPDSAQAGTVNPVQSTTYALTTANNPITFGSGTNINTTNPNAVYGSGAAAWNVSNTGQIQSRYLWFPPNIYHGTGIRLAQGGTVANQISGSIYGGANGISSGGYGLGGLTTITNAGSITGGWGSAIGVANADAVVVNQAGATITSPHGGGVSVDFSSLTLTNAGRINSYLEAVTAYNGAPSTVTNLTGGVIGNLTGSTSTSSVAGVALNTGTVVNQAGATILGHYFAVGAALGPGMVTNAGSIVGGDVFGSTVRFLHGGTVNNQTGGSITGGNSAVRIDGGGSVVNDGLIQASTFQGILFNNGGTVNNTVNGVISGPRYGVFVTGGAGGIVNAGQITGGTNAVLLNAGGHVSNLAGGTISSSQNAIQISGGAGNVTNAGVLSSTSSAAVLFQGGGSVANYAGGSINGLFLGVYIAGGAGSVTNDGSIYGKVSVAVRVNSGTVTNSAGGSITSLTEGVLVGSGSVTNAGLISGAQQSVVFGGPGANTLTLQTGSTLVGDAVGSTASGATNALILQGAGTANNNFDNFNTIDAQGPGTWTLGGKSSVDLTEVSGGTLILAGSLTSAVEIDNGATLVASSSNLQVSDSAIAANALTGGPFISGGMLVVVVQSLAFRRLETSLAHGVVVDNGTLVFDQATDGSFANRIGGSGAIIKQNVGTLTLDGISSVATTTVNAGDLAIGDPTYPLARLTSAVTVNAGGTLSGHGTIVGSVTNNGGTVRPGGTIGTLTINGNYTQSPNGTLSLEVSPTANSSLAVSGTANLAGSLQLAADPGIYRKGTKFNVLTAGSVSGAFSTATITNGLPFSVTVSNGDVVATLLSGNFSAVGANANQSAIGAAFANYPVGVSDFDPVADALIALPAGAAQNHALDTLGGEVDADLMTAGRDSARQVLDSVTSALSDAGRDASGRAHAAWGRLYGGFGGLKGDGSSHSFASNDGGAIVGVQQDWAGLGVLGAAISYDHADLSLNGLDQHGALDSVALSGYGERRFGPLFIDGAASLAYDYGHADRRIAFSTIDRRAQGGSSGFTEGAWAGAGARSASANGVWIEESVGVAYSHVQLDGFTEHGAGGADLAVGQRTQDAAEGVMQVKIAKTFALANGDLRLDGRVAGLWELASARPDVGERFAAAPGTDFTLTGAPTGKTGGEAGLGVTYEGRKGASVFARYDGAFSGGRRDAAFTIGGRIAW